MSSSRITDENEHGSVNPSSKIANEKNKVKKLSAFRERYYGSKSRETQQGIFTTAIQNRLRGGEYKPRGKPGSKETDSSRTKEDALNDFWYDVRTKIKRSIVDLELFFEIASRYQIDLLNEDREKIIFLKDHEKIHWKEEDNDGKIQDRKCGPFKKDMIIYPSDLPDDIINSLQRDGIVDIVSSREPKDSPFKQFAINTFHTPLVNQDPYDETLGEIALDFISNGVDYLLAYNLQSQTEQPSRKQVVDALEILRSLGRAHRMPVGSRRNYPLMPR